tara:strand:+ start:22 stop:210 length:189 start_codon:yes stop_codon:yes gene_type:complete
MDNGFNTDYNARSALTAIWEVLHGYREDLIPEGDESYDSQWDDICESMAAIHEALNIDQADT